MLIDSLDRFVERVLSYHKSYCNDNCFGITDIIDCLMLEVGLLDITDNRDRIILANKEFDRDRFNHLFDSVHTIFKEYVEV